MNAKRLLLAPFAIVLTLTVFQSNTHADIRAVALYGQLAPGFTSGHFSDFGEASVNASGDMAFYAWVDVGGFQNSGIFAVLGGVLTPIALQGQPLPDGSGRKFLAAFSAPKINDNGTIVFSAQFTPGTVTTNYRGIFEYSAGTLQGVFDESTPAFSGGHFGFEEAAPVLINNSGKIALRAYFGSLGASIGIFTLSQGVVQYVFSAAGPDDIQFALNNNGDMALGNALGLLTGAIARGISISSGGTITQIVTYGQAVPNSNLVVSGGPVLRQSMMRKTSSFLLMAAVRGYITHSHFRTGSFGGAQVPWRRSWRQVTAFRACRALCSTRLSANRR